MIPVTQRTWARLLALACGGWVALALARTERVAQAIGAERVGGARPGRP